MLLLFLLKSLFIQSLTFGYKTLVSFYTEALLYKNINSQLERNWSVLCFIDFCNIIKLGISCFYDFARFNSDKVPTDTIKLVLCYFFVPSPPSKRYSEVRWQLIEFLIHRKTSSSNQKCAVTQYLTLIYEFGEQNEKFNGLDCFEPLNGIGL